MCLRTQTNVTLCDRDGQKAARGRPGFHSHKLPAQQQQQQQQQ